MIKNIILIGMPGAGKSTVGVLLAKALGMNFCDTDILIQNRERTTLQNIINNQGLEKFLEIENDVLACAKMENTVVATGGSAVYGSEAMENLCKNGIVVYLMLSPKVLQPRLSNISTRGVVIRKGQSITDLYQERHPLYVKYAKHIIEADRLNTEETVTAIIQALNC